MQSTSKCAEDSWFYGQFLVAPQRSSLASTCRQGPILPLSTHTFPFLRAHPPIPWPLIEPPIPPSPFLTSSAPCNGEIFRCCCIAFSLCASNFVFLPVYHGGNIVFPSALPRRHWPRLHHALPIRYFCRSTRVRLW